jgi:hypothetical protein
MSRPSPARQEVLALMQQDAGDAMRRHLKAYFATGKADPHAFLEDMARPLVSVLQGLGMEGLRDEQGAALPVEDIRRLAKDAMGRAFDPFHSAPEPTP